MPAFLDTSVLISRLFNQTPQLSDNEWNSLENPHASELVRVESCRVIKRQKLDSDWSDQIFAESLFALETLLSGIILVSLDSQILSRACQPFGVRLKKGMIYSPSYGDTEFTVPLFDDFMRRVMPLDL